MLNYIDSVLGPLYFKSLYCIVLLSIMHWRISFYIKIVVDVGPNFVYYYFYFKEFYYERHQWL
jgi:hypothetical protein